MLDDHGLRLGNLPDLMSPRFGVAALQLRTTTATHGRLVRNHRVALLGWNQRPLVLRVPRLTAASLGRLRLARRGLRMRMLGGSEEFCGVWPAHASNAAIR